MSYYKLIRQAPEGKAVRGTLCKVEHRYSGSGIRIHRGTLPEHSKGCILVSAENEQKLTALWLKEQNDHEECRLEIH